MAYRIELPRSETKLSRDFFARDAATVAQDLLGRVFVFEKELGNPIYAQLQEIAAYEKKADSMAKTGLYAPGIMGISTKFGKRLIDIGTLELGKPSCVTLISAIVGRKDGLGKLIEGPGNLSAELEMDKKYDSLPIDLYPVWIGGERIESSRIIKRSVSGQPDNFKGKFYFRL